MSASSGVGTLQRRDLQPLPKAHLHQHLEGSIRHSTAVELADRYGLPEPARGQYQDLPGFVQAYESARDLVRTLDDLARITVEIIEDAAEQGIVWTELHAVPMNYAGRLGPPEGVLEAVLDGLARGSASSSSEAAVVMAHNRSRTADEAATTVELARRYAHQGVVGLGLVGNEADFPPELFEKQFAGVHESGLKPVPHAGEAAGPASVWTAWQRLGAQRICHGVRALEDPHLVYALADAEVCLDVCPTSNVALGASPALDRHQLPGLFRSGVPVSLGSDCPAFFGVDLLDEYLAAHDFMGLDDQELAGIAWNSLYYSAAPEGVKEQARTRIDGWLRVRFPSR